MSILIKGMEMPETCFECPFMFARRYCCASLTLDLYQGDYDEIKGRVDGCPLVNLPPHGRLGDLDRLEKELVFDCAYASAEICKAAPTVIEAEE